MADQPPIDHTQELLRRIRDQIEEGFASLREEQARTNGSVAAMARTLVTVERDIRLMQRDLKALTDRVTVLTVAYGEPPPAHI